MATLGGISIPTNSAIKSTNRTKTWKKVSIKQIAQEIAKRYSLKLIFDGPNYTIKSIEQTDKSDSSFLYDLCKDYGLGMKVYKSKIVIWGKSKYEGKKATATIKRADFIGDDWDYTDTLEGTYTGARTSYKKGNDSKEISIYVGLVGEKAKGARTLKISEQSDSENDARYKAAAKVNLENEKATVLTGTIFARPEIVAGICVKVKDLGKADGKYFVDEVKTKVSDSGTTQEIQLHKCQKQLKGDPPPAPPAPAAPAKKTYKVGDIVNFHGGTHYYSSYPGARGYSARAGRAKITLGPDCRGNGHAHPWHLIHVTNITETDGGADPESDESLKDRIYIAPSRYSTAGTEEAYVYWVKTYNSTIADVKVSSDNPGEVDIVFLMDDGIPSREMITGLTKYITDPNIRPLTDKVVVKAPTVVNYSISLTYYINSSDSGSVATIQSEVAKAVDDFVTWQQSKIGRDINSSELIKRVTAAGAKRVEIKSPVFQKIGGTSIAYCTSKNVTYGGVEDD